MAADKTTDAIKLNLRMPKGLHRRLTRTAARNNVSLNTQIINELEGYEAATIQRMTEIVEPLLKEAVKASASVASEVASRVTLEILQGPGIKFVEDPDEKE